LNNPYIGKLDSFSDPSSAYKVKKLTLFIGLTSTMFSDIVPNNIVELSWLISPTPAPPNEFEYL
jgi:hypothetical protein